MKKDNIEVRQAAEMIKKALNGNKKYDREIWQAINKPSPRNQTQRGLLII